MLRTLAISLRPTEEQRESLLRMMETFNAACNFVSEVAWESGEFNAYRLRAEVYGDVRGRFKLSAQLAQQAIKRVTDAYRSGRRQRVSFGKYSAVSYDSKTLRVVGFYVVSIRLLSGREWVRLSTGGYHANRLRGATYLEADLCYDEQKRRFRLHLVLESPDPAKDVPEDFLGVDLGIVNLAVDSDGTNYPNARARSLRIRYRKLQAKLARKPTRSARRLRLRNKRRRKESRFARHTDHCVSKRIVAAAKGTHRGIVLENLTGILDGITVSRAQRAAFASWSFRRLRRFIEYKAEAAGVPVVIVDPKDSSLTCPACGHVAKANRPSRSVFSCKSCAYAGDADFVAALILRNRGRAAVSRPHADSS